MIAQLFDELSNSNTRFDYGFNRNLVPQSLYGEKSITLHTLKKFYLQIEIFVIYGSNIFRTFNMLVIVRREDFEAQVCLPNLRHGQGWIHFKWRTLPG